MWLAFSLEKLGEQKDLFGEHEVSEVLSNLNPSLLSKQQR